jgi:hypothetical protein
MEGTFAEEQAGQVLGAVPFGVVPFEVNEDSIDLGNLTDAKRVNKLIPPLDNQILTIKKARVFGNKDGTWKGLEITYIFEGYQEGDKMVFKGKQIQGDIITLFADPSKYDEDMAKNGKYEMKKLALALGEDITAVRINETYLGTFVGRKVMGNIRQVKNTWNVDENGEMKNVIKGVKKAPDGV